jgi:hypothetical protein
LIDGLSANRDPSAGSATGFQGRRFVRTSDDVIGFDLTARANPVEVNFADGVNGFLEKWRKCVKAEVMKCKKRVDRRFEFLVPKACPPWWVELGNGGAGRRRHGMV